MEWVLAFLVVSAVAGCLGVVLLVQLVRALHQRVLVVADHAAVAARACAGGLGGEVARCRRDLGRSLQGTRRALGVARAAGAPVGDVPSLLVRLEVAAGQVETELRMVEAVTDRSRAAAALPGPRSRAEAIMSSAADLTTGLLHAAGDGAADVALLQVECRIEADALHEAADAGRPRLHPGPAPRPPAG